MSDYRMAYVDSIDRVPVLLIHGFPLSSELWDGQIAELSDIARMVAPDLRGHGESHPTEPGFGLERYADDCVALLDDLGLDGPVVVAGLSMGGYIAFEIFRRHPERVGGLILAATRAGADSAEAQKNRQASAEKVAADGVDPVVDAMAGKLLAPGNYDAMPEVAGFVREMMAGTSVEGMIAALLAMKDRTDSTPTLAEIDVPTLIVHGVEDQLIPFAEAEAMHKGIAGSQLAAIRDAGHLPNLEQPAAFEDAVRGFLEQFYED
jgi:3-oxoadipate enol-lactonase